MAKTYKDQKSLMVFKKVEKSNLSETQTHERKI